jgi:hypothetical protein
MDSRPLKYCMASLWLSNAYLSNTRGESFLFDMINAGSILNGLNYARQLIKEMMSKLNVN